MDRQTLLRSAPLACKCRSCTSIQLRPIVDFGLTPLANRLLDKRDEQEPRYPLQLVRCANCDLVQITYTVPREKLFSHYLYFSSCSPPLVLAARDLALRLIEERKLGPDSLVIEAASNDGYLLQHYKRRDIPVLGFEPAKNIAAEANAKGIETLNSFFPFGITDQCDVFHANNVLPHVADLNGFVWGIKQVLKPDGIAVIECSDVNRMFADTQFDFIYHEHLCYFSTTSLFHLFKRHDLEISAIERIPAHGGSLRVFVRHPQPYENFAAKVDVAGRHLRELVTRITDQGKTIAGYGAAAKGTMILNYNGLDELQFVCDSTPAKQGKFMPGMRTPIVHPSELAKRQPDYCLILAWNYAEEIMGKEHEYRGKWIIPIPVVRCVDSVHGRLGQSEQVHGSAA